MLNSRSPNQQIPHLLWNQEIYDRVYNCPPLTPILSQMNPVHSSNSTYLKSILVLSSSHIRQNVSRCPFLSDFLIKIFCTFLAFLMTSSLLHTSYIIILNIPVFSYSKLCNLSS